MLFIYCVTGFPPSLRAFIMAVVFMRLYVFAKYDALSSLHACTRCCWFLPLRCFLSFIMSVYAVFAYYCIALPYISF